MNGWMRLWVLITAIWAVIVVGVTIIIIVDTFDDVDGPWVAYGLSDNAKPFFQNLKPGEKGPVYTVEFSYTDGMKKSIRFPLLESVDLIEFDRKIKNLVKEEGKNVSENEMRRLLGVVSKKNSEAKSALVEYQHEVENRANIKANDRKQAFGISALALVIPPVVLLLLGYGIAWVRRGFT